LARQPRFCGNPAFVGTMFFSSMSFVERWERFAAVKSLGRALEGWERIIVAIRWWSSCSIFGCGPRASAWDKITLCHLNEKWSSHYESMCASRRGQILQAWRTIVRRTVHRAYWKRYERIRCSKQACLFALLSRWQITSHIV
jgi:hypothetical protein